MIRLSIRRPVAVAMVYAGVSLLGIVAWRNIPIELLPDTDLPQLTISAGWPGASPEITEAFLTAPIEAAVQQVRGVERITSQSDQLQGAGTTTIQAFFARETDMDFARLELSERLAALEDDLPPTASRPRLQDYVPEEFEEQSRPFLAYTVTGPYTLETLRAYVDQHLLPELVKLEGVGAVEARGGRRRLLEIELQETRIEALGLSPERVGEAVRGLEVVQQAGQVSAGGVLHTISLRERADDPEEIRQLPLLSDGGRLVRLGDVAVVRDTYEEATSYYRIDGQPALSFQVYREPATNAVSTADRVKAKVGEMERAVPAGVRLILDDDQSVDIRAQLSDLRTRALAAAAIVFAVLLLFLRSWRSAALAFASMAASVLITLNLIYFGGLSLNVLTLMGLAMGFGMIIDNSVVVLDNIYRHRANGASAEAAAEQGARGMVLPVLAATLTTLVVLIPFVYLQGELRVYYVPLAIVVALTNAASLFVSFSLLPALASHGLPRKLSARVDSAPRPAPLALPALSEVEGSGVEGPLSEPDARSLSEAEGPLSEPDARSLSEAEGPLSEPDDRSPREVEGSKVEASGAESWPIYTRVYATMTRWTLHHPWITVTLSVMLLGGSFYLFDRYVTRGVRWGGWGGADTYISIQITLPRGEELARMEELTSHFEDLLDATPEVGRYVTNVQPQRADIRVTFPDSIANTFIPVGIKGRLEDYSHEFGGADVRVYGYGPSFYGGGGFSAPNYGIQVLGYNYETVREIAEDVRQRLMRFSRIENVDPNASSNRYVPDRATELVLTIDRESAALHGLSARDVVQRVRVAVSGNAGRSSTLRVGGEELLFSVKLAGHETIDDLALHELLLPGPTGQGVRLGDVATLSERQVQTTILRENQEYQRSVAYEFRGPTKLGDRVRDAVVEATDMPPGFRIAADDRYRWSPEERQQIYGVLGVSLLLVFMVTAALFESVRQPLVVLLSVPMALVGVFLLFFYTGASFTREAYIGVIMMGGVVVNNAILLVDHINVVCRSGTLPFRDAILQATLDRTRPILMTTTTTVLGLLPLVLFSGYADANIWNALGYALIGGLTSSTFLILTVTPALYYLFERGIDRRRLRNEAAIEGIAS